MAASAANVEKIRQELVAKTKAMGIEAEITGRVKRYWSIRQKLIRQAIPLEQLYDVLAFRVLVDSIPDCYTVLGIVHQAWRPVPGRIKDYIAMPKRNFYQSLHTTLVPERAPPFEVQIRTREMDLIAENGIAAHWKYKEGKPVRSDARHEEHVGVLRQILETTKDVSDDGRVNIASSDGPSAQKAIEIISNLTASPEVGKTYKGKVVRIAEFGAFVEIFPGTDGLLHISEIDENRIRNVRDVLQEGDQVMVKVVGLEGNKIKLSRKAVLRDQKQSAEQKG